MTIYGASDPFSGENNLLEITSPHSRPDIGESLAGVSVMDT